LAGKPAPQTTSHEVDYTGLVSAVDGGGAYMLCLCGEPVLRVGEPPILLGTEPDPLGIYAPDGTKLKIRDIARAGASHRALKRHYCISTEVDPCETLLGVGE
jgi:hypothetical protein